MVVAYAAPSYGNFQFSFQWLKNGDFDVNEKERPGESKEVQQPRIAKLIGRKSAKNV